MTVGGGAGGGARSSATKPRGRARRGDARRAERGRGACARHPAREPRARAKTWPTCDDRGTRSLGEETQATPVSSRSSALCKRVLRSEWHPRIWRNCSYPIWASSMQKVHSAGIQCALFYPLSSRFSSFARSRGGSPSRAHTVTRAPRPRPTSPPAFPSARYPRFPPRARTPRPAVSPALARHVLRRRVRRAPAQPQGRPARAALREQERDRLLQRGGAHERRVCVSIPRSARSAIAPRPRTNRASRDAPAPRHARRQTLIDLIDWDGSRRTSAVSDPAADPASSPRPGPPGLFSQAAARTSGSTATARASPAAR